MSEQKPQQFDLMTSDDKRSLIAGAEKSVMAMKDKGLIEVPPNYSIGNALNSAYLAISDVVDRDKNPALSVCTKSSIAKALLTTVTLGLTPAKNQIYYIVYGKTLNAQRSYLGTAAIAKRMKGVEGEPRAQAIFEGDNVTFETVEGYKVNLKHQQKFGNIDTSKVIGAYATIKYNGEYISEVMTLAQCRKAWQMGKAKGVSPAHTGFPDEMCKKTVISRLCKMIINTSDDSDILTSAFNESGFVQADTEELLENNMTNAAEASDTVPTIDIED
jgi:recombination protein RecT